MVRKMTPERKARFYLKRPNINVKYRSGRAEYCRRAVIFSGAAMQAWRRRQEDKYKCLPKLCNNIAFFAVYDGHGGSEISEYLQENLHCEMRKYLRLTEGDIELALYLAFLSTDLNLRHPQTISELNVTVGCHNKELSIEKKRQLLEQLKARKNDASATSQQSESTSEAMQVSAGTSGSNGPSSNGAAGSTVSSSEAEGPASTGVQEEEMSTSLSVAAGSSTVGVENDTVSSSATEISASSGVAGESTTTATISATTVSGSTVQDTGSNSVPEDLSATEASDPTQESTTATTIPLSKDIQTGSGSTWRCKIVQDSGDKAMSEDPNEPEASGPAQDSNCAGSSAETLVAVAGPSQPCGDSTEEDTEIEDDSMEEAVSDIGQEDVDRPLDFLLNEELESSDTEDEDFFYSDDETESEGSDDGISEPKSKKMTAEEFANMQPGDYSGSTATVAVIDEDKIYVANVGDSRCVLSRKGVAIDMTIDHKPTDPEELKRILLNGGSVRMGRINDSVDMSRAFGDFRLKGESETPCEQCITAEPIIKTISITQDDDFLILASDGIWNAMTSQEVVDFVNMRYKHEDCDLRDICYELFQLILSPDLDNDGTGCDNMSCIIIKFCKKPCPDVKELSST